MDAMSKPPEINEDRATQRTPHPPLPPLRFPFHPKIPCSRPLHEDPTFGLLNVPLFISTDASSPRTHPLLTLFLATFPCTFFLSDLEPFHVSLPFGENCVELTQL